MIDDSAWAARAQPFVTMILVRELMVALCLAADDPLAEVAKRSKSSLNALDQVAEMPNHNQTFMQHALHEMEQFWEAVEFSVRVLVEHGSR